MREGSFDSAGGGWLRVWSIFAGLLLLTTALAYWMHRPQAAGEVHAGVVAAAPASADERAGKRAVPVGFMRAPSGRLLPRFVSLAKADATVRTGPGKAYPVAWIVRLRGLPLKVVAEAGDYWRVRDAEGAEGWMHRAALSDERTALVAPWNLRGRQPLRARPDDAAPLRAWLAGGVLARLVRCDGRWCAIEVPGARGWVRQDLLWGVHAGEKLNVAASAPAP